MLRQRQTDRRRDAADDWQPSDLRQEPRLPLYQPAAGYDSVASSLDATLELYFSLSACVFSALTPLVGRQEGHPA